MGLKSLTTLDLNENKISVIQIDAFSHLLKLKKLMLNGNKIVEIHKDIFYTKIMMNNECNIYLLFIKYIYYTVQVESCYNVAHM